MGESGAEGKTLNTVGNTSTPLGLSLSKLCLFLLVLEEERQAFDRLRPDGV
jgi:hypothetical protein